MALIQYLKNARGTGLVLGGHRGHQSDVRENTIENFRQLDSRYVPYIEIDVQLTKDRKPVIFHDARLEDSTPAQGTVRDHTLEELRRQFGINTVDEVVSWAKEAHMGIAFELKLYPMYTEEERACAADCLVEVIQRFSFQEDCFVFGKDYQTLKRIRNRDAEIHLAIIAPKDPETAFPLMRELDAFMYLDFLSGLNEQLMERLHREGYLVDGSVVNTEEALSQALTLGVDMIESDYPERIIPLLYPNG